MKNYIKYNENEDIKRKTVSDYLHLNDDLEIKFNFIILPVATFYCYDRKTIFYIQPQNILFTKNKKYYINVKYDIEVFKKIFGIKEQQIEIEKYMNIIFSEYIKNDIKIYLYNSVFTFWEENDNNLYD